MEPQGCHAQALFTSNLHSFWKVADTLQAEETNDERLLALQKFGLELKKLDAENRPRSTGMFYLLITAKL